MKNLINKIICFFKGHDFHALVMNNKKTHVLECSRCGKIMYQLKSREGKFTWHMVKQKKKKNITFGEILHIVDFSATVICYVNDEEEPIWEGFASNVPYWLAEMPLNLDKVDGEEHAIDFRHSLGKKYDNKPGFVVCLKEED